MNLPCFSLKVFPLLIVSIYLTNLNASTVDLQQRSLQPYRTSVAAPKQFLLKSTNSLKLQNLKFKNAHGLTYQSKAKGGASDGGGGGVVLQNNQYILTDFFNLKTLPTHLTENPGSSKIDQALSDSIKIAQTWIDLPLDLIGYRLFTALHVDLKWEFTKEDLHTPPFFRATHLPDDAEIIPAAYYKMNAGTHTVSLFHPVWKLLSAKNQSALIVHEAFRQVQIGYGVEFDDETLQKASVIFMTCKPSVKLNQYMNLLVLNLVADATERFGSFDSLTENCGELR